MDICFPCLINFNVEDIRLLFSININIREISSHINVNVRDIYP
jgi:hypothetical protein